MYFYTEEVGSSMGIENNLGFSLYTTLLYCWDDKQVVIPMLGPPTWTLVTVLFHIYISAILFVHFSSHATLSD